MENMNQTIVGRNAVMEVLRAGHQLDQIYVQRPPHTGSLNKILALAREGGVRVREVGKDKLDQLAGGENHQGVVALALAYAYTDVSDILALAEKKGQPPFLLVLESIQDPHNLGAILRSADAAGIHGVIISKRRAVGLTAAVAKTAAGALEYVPVAQVTNISRTLEELKKKGIWTACADMDGDPMYARDLTGPLALVIGGEHEGVSRLVRETCDFVVSIPMKGAISTLNASVATAVLLYEALRQRDWHQNQ